MKSLPLLLALSPALAAAQPYVVDRVPTPATEVAPLYNIGTTADARGVVERFTVTEQIFINDVFLYGQLPASVSIDFHSGPSASTGNLLFGSGRDLVDLGAVTGSSYETRKYGLSSNEYFGTLLPGTYWVFVRFSESATLARVSSVDDGLIRTANLFGRNQAVVTGGDLAITFGVVPEPASFIALVASLGAWRRRGRAVR